MPFIYEEDTMLSLHFDIGSTQSSMRKNDPEYLVLLYTRTMMGFLFFQPKPKKIVMIGLGGGSLAKYCARYLPDAHFTAVEINPKVIAMRDQFMIPEDSEKFKVVCANGADYVSNRPEKVDVLLVDGFDSYGQPANLTSAGFYDNCFSMLNTGGVLVVNLLTSDPKFGTYSARIRDSFDDKVVVIDAEESGNRIALAYKGGDFPLPSKVLRERIRILEPKHRFPLHIIAQKILHRQKQHKSLPERERL